MIKKKRWSKGFTVVELLVTAAIIIILAAIAMAAAASHMKLLKITELDNAAREIYMAAENRAVLLFNNGRLDSALPPDSFTLSVADESGDTKELHMRYVSFRPAEQHSILLPVGSIDPALADGYFYVVYEPTTGSVTDVFYAEKPIETGDDFKAFYDKWKAAPKKTRMEPMLGYYGGGPAESGSTGALYTPIIEIENKEKLILRVSYKVPLSAEGAKLDVKLTYHGSTQQLLLPGTVPVPDGDTLSYSCEWVLDSLEGGNQFKDLFPSDMGGDFTVTASVSYQGVSESSRSATDNSLFAKGSGKETAKIEYLRHLQNLDPDFSGVKGKTKAEQTADIKCAENEVYPGYVFIPIANESLKAYDGGKKTIYGLTVETDKPNAGLFTEVKDGKISNVRLADARITGGNIAGAIVGAAQNTDFDNCYVYWELPLGAANLRGILGDESGYHYAITGKTVGSLAGTMQGGTIKHSIGATLLQGDTAGGLAGTAFGVAVENSYADCYLAGKNAAGLFGVASGSITLKDVYSAGFITAGTAAGLCLGGATVAASNAYTVMRYPDSQNITPLADTITGTCFYLGTNAGDSGARSYEHMASEKFLADLDGNFVFKDRKNSHPYNLRTDLDLDVYAFPGLKDMPHYGDWGAQFQKTSLVYYERYTDGSYGFQGGGISTLKNQPVTLDGYAVAMTDTSPDKITYTWQENAESEKTEDILYKNLIDVKDGENKYILAPLPDEIVNSGYAAQDFYQKISFSFTAGTDNYEGHYYYSPHFAGTAVEVDAGDPAPAAKDLAVSVRAPRHLHNLSRYEAYYHNDNGYTFHQELPLDYTVYTGYGFAVSAQDPIGRATAPFNGTYDGHCNEISNIAFRLLDGNDLPYAGFFGFSTGTLRNVVYTMPEKIEIAIGSGPVNHYLGCLAGGNAGTITNCAVSGATLTGLTYGGRLYVGGLVGQNQSIIQNSAAEAALLSTDNSAFAEATVGGLAGENTASGVISSSYAVGRITSEVDKNSSARICGFAGYNAGNIQNSYAAVDLRSSGERVETFGFCGVTNGTQSGTRFLNNGNFTYRGISYNAGYKPRKAAEKTYDELTVETIPGMVFLGDNSGYPYPAAVKNAKGEPVHYGEWPAPMKLGNMGVYYWERLETEGKTSYDISLLAVDTEKNAIEKLTTLSEAYNDGGVVEDYGYGYYAKDGNAVTFAPQYIYYYYPGGSSVIGLSSWNAAGFEDKEINQKLGELMAGYDFHAFHSYGMGNGGSGLYPARSGTGTGGGKDDGKETINDPNGAFKLRQGNISVSFRINPHFADALSVNREDTFEGVNPNTYERYLFNGSVSDEVLLRNPGMTEENPFGIRAISQLQNINWNTESYNSSNILNADTFFKAYWYISSEANPIRQYYWTQTHDITGGKMMPIAEFSSYIENTWQHNNLKNLSGWFGGVYDGDDYKIEGVSIEGRDSATCGLFGAVYNGTLKNIVLYSPNGDGSVTAGGETNCYWYAMGVLAGVVGGNGSVENCVAAGYTLNADVICNPPDMGAAGSYIGGLIGFSDVPLKNCSAVVDIDVPKTAEEKANMHIGGLVGSCQKNITNCYTGGEIRIDKGMTVKERGLSIGGIVGSSYFSTLNVYGQTGRIGTVGAENPASVSNKLENCYTYMTLPDQTEVDYWYGTVLDKRIGAYYAIGGSGENDKANCTVTNCFYLSSEVLKGITTQIINSSGRFTDMDGKTLDVVPVRYNQLNGQEQINGSRIYEYLQAFQPVTSQAGDFLLAGKYSFAPTNRKELQGLNYPFPTIQTREDGRYHVHYGEWPNIGIWRENGSEPISLDIFTNASHKETLKILAEGAAPSGAWNVASSNPDIVSADVQDGALSVTAQKTGHTTLTITYGLGTNSYSLDVDVNVTAVLEFRPAESPVVLYANDAADVLLTPYGKDGSILDLTGITLTKVEAVTNEAAAFETLRVTQEGNHLRLTVKTNDVGTSAAVNIACDYSYNGNPYSGLNPVTVQIINITPETVEIKPGETRSVGISFAVRDKTVTILSMDIKNEKPGIAAAGVPKADGSTVEIPITGVAAGETAVTLTAQVMVGAQAHSVEVEIPVLVSGTKAAGQAEEPAAVAGETAASGRETPVE